MPSQLRVAVLDDYQRVALDVADWSALSGRCAVTVFDERLTTEDEAAERLAGFEIIVAMRERTPFPASLLDRLPALRLLVSTGRANAAIDLAPARRNGVLVCGTESGTVAPAEHTWALLLALLKRVPQADALIRSGGWQDGIGGELAGRTLGLLGLGRIGQLMARYARAFDMDVLAWSANLTDEHAREHGARRVPKDELFGASGIVSVHLKLSDRSRGLVGARELELLGPDGYLVNTSRGPIVDEAALVKALRDGTIAGAALDVFDTEPLPPGHPLRTAPNTVLTGHTGYVTRENYATFYAGAVEDIAAWLDGRPLRVLT